MSRWKAAALHLLISAIVVGSLVLGVTLIWYPPAIWHMAATGKLLLTLALVDVVIGPLLTLVVFRTGKPGLRRDLTIIAILQIAALGYGIWTIATTRPVFVVGVGSAGRFHLVFANEVDLDSSPLPASLGIEHLPWFSPPLVGAVLPTDPEAREALMFSALAGQDVQHLPQYYVPYADVRSLLLSRWAEHGARDADGRCIAPYLSSRGEAGMQIDCSTGDVMGPVAGPVADSN